MNKTFALVAFCPPPHILECCFREQCSEDAATYRNEEWHALGEITEFNRARISYR